MLCLLVAGNECRPRVRNSHSATVNSCVRAWGEGRGLSPAQGRCPSAGARRRTERRAGLIDRFILHARAVLFMCTWPAGAADQSGGVLQEVAACLSSGQQPQAQAVSELAAGAVLTVAWAAYPDHGLLAH